MAENLKTHVGKRVTLYLSSGIQITGKVKALSQHVVHMEKISNRDFMDALIQIESIEAIEGRFRAYQRDLERMGLKEK
jgi:small nuclear ribonucleoprotein (snRNP)-like protein